MNLTKTMISGDKRPDGPSNTLIDVIRRGVDPNGKVHPPSTWSGFRELTEK